MAYTDKDKQRDAGKERQRRYRENRKALHPAIRAGIERLTVNPDGSIDEVARTSRMACAIAYQRLYPAKTYTGREASDMINKPPTDQSITEQVNADTISLCQANGYDWHIIAGVVHPLNRKHALLSKGGGKGRPGASA